MSTENIELYSKNHGIEAEQFTVVFRGSIDSADDGRFEEARQQIEELFRAIDEPNLVHVVMGGPQPPKPVLKVLNDFGRNGMPEWSGQFGENAVSVTSNQYTNWLDVWPSIETRLNTLIKCVDPFKFVGSIDYRVTDHLRERVVPGVQQTLLGPNILRKGPWVPDALLGYDDPRWDFSGGMFHNATADTEVLERVEMRSFRNGSYVVTTLSNTFSHRFKGGVRLKDILQDGTISGVIESIFSDFHDRNKVTVRSILTDELLERMGLGK